jgi:hypothetical protein
MPTVAIGTAYADNQNGLCRLDWFRSASCQWLSNRIFLQMCSGKPIIRREICSRGGALCTPFHFLIFPSLYLVNY